MPRPSSIDVESIIIRELQRLGKVRMPYTEFVAQAEFSEEEKAAFAASIGKKNRFFYVDAYTDPQNPQTMVGLGLLESSF